MRLNLGFLQPIAVLWASVQPGVQTHLAGAGMPYHIPRDTGGICRLALAARRNVTPSGFVQSRGAIDADVAQHRVGHVPEVVAFALNTSDEALLPQPLTECLHEAASRSGGTRGEVFWAILGIMSHRVTYQFVCNVHAIYQRMLTIGYVTGISETNYFELTIHKY
jgi:hypothetical protein